MNLQDVSSIVLRQEFAHVAECGLATELNSPVTLTQAAKSGQITVPYLITVVNTT